MQQIRRFSPVHRGMSRARFLLPIAGTGLIIACLAIWMQSVPESHTVSHVTRLIRDIALAAGAPNADREAGVIGPWRIAAESFDPTTGEFTFFHLESGPMVLTAATAQLNVDPVNDTFSFELREVVYTRLPDPRDTEQESFVHTLDHYTLGPAPYGMNIVADGGSERSQPDRTPDELPSSVVNAEELVGG